MPEPESTTEISKLVMPSAELLERLITETIYEIKNVKRGGATVLCGPAQTGKTWVLKEMGLALEKQEGYEILFLDMAAGDLSSVEEVSKGREGLRRIMLADDVTNENMGRLEELIKSEEGKGTYFVWATRSRAVAEISSKYKWPDDKNPSVKEIEIPPQKEIRDWAKKAVYPLKWGQKALIELKRFACVHPLYLKIACEELNKSLVRQVETTDKRISVEMVRSALGADLEIMRDIISEALDGIPDSSLRALCGLAKQFSFEIPMAALQSVADDDIMKMEECSMLFRNHQGNLYLPELVRKELLENPRISNMGAVGEELVTERLPSDMLLSVEGQTIAPAPPGTSYNSRLVGVPVADSSREIEAVYREEKEDPKTGGKPSEVEGNDATEFCGSVLLEAKNLKVNTINGKEVMPPVNLKVADGDVLFLWGSSGSGKSTFIKLCLGIMSQNFDVGGSLEFRPPGVEKPLDIILDGVPRWDLLRTLSGTHFGYCPQNPFTRFDSREALDAQLAKSQFHESCLRLPGFRIFRDAGLPSIYLKMASLLYLASKETREEYRQDILEPLLEERFINTEFHTADGDRQSELKQELANLRALPHQRSYGYIQKVSMLQSSSSLSILFLDEPFNALDLVRRQQLLRYCIDLMKRGEAHALVCATHDQQVIRTFRAEVARKSGEGRSIRCPRFKMKEGILEEDQETDFSIVRGQQIESSGGAEVKADRGPIRKESSGKIFQFSTEGVTWREGQIVGIVGNSNCGKSALGRHICDWGKSSTQRQYVPQSPFSGFNPSLPLMDCIPSNEVYNRLRGLARRTQKIFKEHKIERSDDLLALLRKPSGFLSGGELQRLRILLALAIDVPELVFLDEPFAHQDAGWRDCLVELLCAEVEGKRAKSAMIVSHDLETLRTICNSMTYLVDFHDYSSDPYLSVTVCAFDVETDKFLGQLKGMAEDDTRWVRIRQQIAKVGEGQIPSNAVNEQIGKHQRHFKALATILDQTSTEPPDTPSRQPAAH